MALSNTPIGAPYDDIYVKIARLMLEVLQLHCNADANDLAGFTQLFSAASALITAVDTFNNYTNIASYVPNYLSRSISLAAFTLLRLLKSGFAQFLNSSIKEDGRSSLFIAINLLKRMSLVNNDISAKSAEFLSAMWTDQTLFKTSDFSSWCKLRIQNRLSMSIVFDSMLVWIETHGCIKLVSARRLAEPEGMTMLGASMKTKPANVYSPRTWIFECVSWFPTFAKYESRRWMFILFYRWAMASRAGLECKLGFPDEWTDMGHFTAVGIYVTLAGTTCDPLYGHEQPSVSVICRYL